MKPSLVLKAITRAVRVNQVVYLEGKPGIGKTSFPKEVARINGWDYSPTPPAPTLDPVDIRGAIKVITKKDIAEFGISPDLLGHTVAFPPDFLPTVANKITIVVFDDLPTASPAVQATLFQLLLERRIGNYVVPDNIRFVLTGNRVEDKAGAGRTLTALDSRVTRISVDVDLDDWVSWALDSDIEPEIIAFHRWSQGQHLWNFDPTKKVNPLPRTWEFVSGFLKDFKAFPESSDVLENEIYSGNVGEFAAATFIGFLRVFKDLPDIDECLSEPNETAVPEDLGAKFAVASAISRAVEKGTFKNFLTYTKRLGDEFQHLAVADAVKLEPTLKESKAYTDWFRANSQAFTR